jgi:hypothetical protein
MGSPHPFIRENYISAKWAGQVQPRFTETYTFHLIADDYRKLWVNGQVVIDNGWVGDVTESSGTITLVAGRKYDIKLEYVEGGYTAQVKLLWSSPSQAREIIPQSRLYPASRPDVCNGYRDSNVIDVSRETSESTRTASVTTQRATAYG